MATLMRAGRYGSARDTVIVFGGLAAMVITIMAAVQFGRDTPVLTAMPILLVVIAFAGYVLLLACCGNKPAMIAFFAVLVFVNDGLFRVRDPGDIGLDWQNSMKLALWGGAFAIGACRLRRSWPLLRGGPCTWALAYIGYAVLSSVYSEAATYSFGTAVGLAAMALLGGALVAEIDEKQILVTFMLSLLVFIALGWVAYYAVPELGRSLFVKLDGSIVERICGLAGQANALGNVLAVFLGVIFLLWYCGHLATWICAPLAGFGVFTLLAADSRTALLAFIVGVTAVVLRRSVWLWGSALLGGASAVLMGMTVPLRDLMNLSSGLSRSGDPTELLTFTGRIDIWQFAWEKIVLNPWIGYGYNSSKFILPQFDGLPGLKIDEAHNMLLQNLLGVGEVGTAPLIILFLHLVVEFVRRPDPRRDLFTFMALVWGVTVAGAFGSTPTVMTMAIFIVMPAARRRVLIHPPVRPLPSSLMAARRPRRSDLAVSRAP